MNLDEAALLARELKERYGLASWRFCFDSSKRRFGRCSWRSKTISLSRHLTFLNNERKVAETILHEIAHALTGPVKEHHGEAWKAMAHKVGCPPVRCYGSDVETPKADWTATCPGCKTEHHRHSRPGSVRSCGRCDSRFNPSFVLKFELSVDLADEGEARRIRANESSRRSKAAARQMRRIASESIFKEPSI